LGRKNQYKGVTMTEPVNQNEIHELRKLQQEAKRQIEEERAKNSNKKELSQEELEALANKMTDEEMNYILALTGELDDETAIKAIKDFTSKSAEEEDESQNTATTYNNHKATVDSKVDGNTRMCFFSMMDLLVKWQKHENHEPLDLHSIVVAKDYEKSKELKMASVVGHIADHDVGEFMSHPHHPNDQRFLDEMLEWFELKKMSQSGMDYAFVGTCIHAFSDQELSDQLKELQTECKIRYPGARIEFHIPEAGFSTSAASEGPCYIATAIYGSYDCPEVWTLRRYRDEKLLQSVFGRIFVKMYYAISPTVVKRFGGTEWFNRFWKCRLNNMVAKLKSKGYDDLPYYDR